MTCHSCIFLLVYIVYKGGLFLNVLDVFVGDKEFALISNNRHARKNEKKMNLTYLQHQSEITERVCFFDATINHCFEAFRGPRAVL